MQSFSCSNIFFFKRLFNANNQLLQIPHLQFVRSKLLLTKKSVIISKLKDLKDIINYSLSCGVITLWAATAAARLSGKRHKVSESSNRSSRCTRETLLADICFPPQQPVGKYVWHCGCSSTITAERLCHWVLMGRSRPVSYTSQLHDYKESCLFRGQLCFFCTDKNSWKHQICFCLTSRYKTRLQEQTHRHLSHLVKWNQLIIIR